MARELVVKFVSNRTMSDKIQIYIRCKSEYVKKWKSGNTGILITCRVTYMEN